MMCGSVSLARLAPKVGALDGARLDAKHHWDDSVIIILNEHDCKKCDIVPVTKKDAPASDSLIIR